MIIHEELTVDISFYYNLYMKVKYNHQQSFAHRFISHMEEVEAADLIRKSNNAR